MWPCYKRQLMARLRRRLSLSLVHLSAVVALALLIAPSALVAQTRTLVVGSSATYPPFAYENPQKQIVGFDIDIIQAVAQKAGLNVRVINTPWTGIFASLNNGDIDLIVSGVTINDKRRRAPTHSSRKSTSPTRPAPIPTSYRAASSSGWPSPAHWRCSRR